MADYEHSITVEAPPQRLFDFLADIRNLPRYFDGMVHAEPADGEAVRVVAVVDEIQREGEAWFHVDGETRSLSWGSEGPHDYRGELFVAGDPDGDEATLTVRLHTEVAEGDRVDAGVRASLDAVQRLVTTGAAPAGQP